MNLFCRSLIATALALFVFDFGKGDRRMTDCSSRDGRDLINHRRNRRMYEGTEVKDGEFSYVVFIKSIIYWNTNKIQSCFERLCTGTLIHPRFVLTTLYCVQGQRYKPRVLIFTIKRPYDDITQNMEFRAAEKVIYEDGELLNVNPVTYAKLGYIALIRLNSTFDNVKEFATLLTLDPIQKEHELVDCHTVGFGLIGRTQLTTPADGLLMPTEYIVLKSKMDFDKCNLNSFSTLEYAETYLCDINPQTTDPKAKTLCKDGDEGSPLLCKLPSYITKPEETANPIVQRSDYYVFGLADVVSNKSDCDKPDERPNALFIYTLKSGAWVNHELDMFDQIQTENDSTFEENITDATSYVDVNWTKSTTTLPDYYDTDDYDNVTRKRSMHRCYSSGLLMQKVRGWFSDHHDRVHAEDAPPSSARRTVSVRLQHLSLLLLFSSLQLDIFLRSCRPPLTRPITF